MPVPLSSARRTRTVLTTPAAQAVVLSAAAACNRATPGPGGSPTDGVGDIGGSPTAAPASVTPGITAPAYPVTHQSYAEGVLAAWRQNQLALGSAATTDYSTHNVPPDTYSTCTDGAAGSTYVRVYNSDGLNYVIRVTNATLGSPHAISGYGDPVPVPPACP